MSLKTASFAILFILLNIVSTSAQTNGSNDPGPGVPRELARWRAQHYSNVSYDLNIDITAGSELLKGTEVIHVTLDGDADRLILDWRTPPAATGKPHGTVSELTVNGTLVDRISEVNDHIVIPGTLLKKGQNVVKLNFQSPIALSGSAVTRYLDREDGSEYVYTLFVPSDASTAFPCFDQPDLKGRFTLSTSVPPDWNVVTNTATRSTTFAAQAGKFIQFQQTEPISTYLFAFAAGPFVAFDAPAQANPPLRLFVRKSKAERARKELPEVFRLQSACLKYLEGYFDFKFPFPKYDLVLIPEFAYGGMEHAGATFLREDAILFPTDPTANDFLSRADVMFHETAHQWFGDLVTMRWFDDLWLKEGFAEFMAYKTIDAVMPEYKTWRVFYQRIKPAAYLTDATKGTTPIYQEIPNLSAAKSAYGNIVYRKAPSMLRQAEFFLGPEKFQHALRDYLKHHAYSNAEWSDLVTEFENGSGKNLTSWAASWVRTRGMPDVRCEWSVNAAGYIDRLVLKQTDVLIEGGSWPMRVKLLLYYANAEAVTLDVSLNGSGETTVPGAMGKKRPSFVFANYQDYGYGRFLLDEKSKDFVIKNLGSIKDDFLRTLLWGSLWDSVRETELDPGVFFDLGLKLVTSETDEVAVQSLLGRMSVIYNRYMSDSQSKVVAERFEGLLSAQMEHASTAGLRSTYFRAFQSAATTDSARARLKKILAGEVSIQGMTIRPRDRFDIITALLTLDDSDTPSLLQVSSISAKTDDEKRYAYAAAAAKADPGVKKSYFDAYLHDTKIPESWIEASLGSFNSIRESELTSPYLAPALAALPQMKRTRKIFFINNWLAAFIGGQCDPTALNTVKLFLEQEKSLDRDLRLKVLESVDGLERCVKIRSRYAVQR